MKKKGNCLGELMIPKVNQNFSGAKVVRLGPFRAGVCWDKKFVVITRNFLKKCCPTIKFGFGTGFWGWDSYP